MALPSDLSSFRIDLSTPLNFPHILLCETIPTAICVYGSPSACILPMAIPPWLADIVIITQSVKEAYWEELYADVDVGSGGNGGSCFGRKIYSDQKRQKQIHSIN